MHSPSDSGLAGRRRDAHRDPIEGVISGAYRSGYVGSKEELLREAIRGVLDENLAEAERIRALKDAGPQEKLEMLVQLVLASYERDCPHMYGYIQEDMAQVTKGETDWGNEMMRKTHRLEKIFYSLIKTGMAQGIFRSDLAPGLAANALFGMHDWTHRWYVPGRKHSAQDIADAFSAIFFQGIQSPEANA